MKNFKAHILVVDDDDGIRDLVKQYLKQRGLITSNYMIPPELCRETYESAMLSGDLYNKNHKTLLNNLISE